MAAHTRKEVVVVNNLLEKVLMDKEARQAAALETVALDDATAGAPWTE